MKDAGDGPRSYKAIWLWLVAVCFAMFAIRSFCWLLYVDSDQLKIQSPNNLGDIALHITYIRNFASGVPLWPENPIYLFSSVRYPAGIDLFNGLLLLIGSRASPRFDLGGLARVSRHILCLQAMGRRFWHSGFSV